VEVDGQYLIVHINSNHVNTISPPIGYTMHGAYVDGNVCNTGLNLSEEIKSMNFQSEQYY
jgi:hypothetical protein